MAEPFHRKIELQSLDDLTYLIGNIRHAAEVEIEKALPQVYTAAEERREDDMRVVVERMVGEYITLTLKTLLPNLSVNGHDLTASQMRAFTSSNPQDLTSSTNKKGAAIKEQITYEPFNAKQWSKATEMMAQEAELIEEIAKLRRDVPRKVVAAQVGAFEAVAGEDEKGIEGVGKGVDEGDGGVELDSKGLERADESRRTWVKGVEGLGRVVERGPGLVARVEKAARAEAYVVGGVV